MAVVLGVLLVAGPIFDFVWDIATESPSAGEVFVRLVSLALGLLLAYWLVVGSYRRATRADSEDRQRWARATGRQ
jgi:cytochrome c biogenesis protein CcdA